MLKHSTYLVISGPEKKGKDLQLIGIEYEVSEVAPIPSGLESCPPIRCQGLDPGDRGAGAGGLPTIMLLESGIKSQTPEYLMTL